MATVCAKCAFIKVRTICTISCKSRLTHTNGWRIWLNAKRLLVTYLASTWTCLDIYNKNTKTKNVTTIIQPFEKLIEWRSFSQKSNRFNSKSAFCKWVLCNINLKSFSDYSLIIRHCLLDIPIQSRTKRSGVGGGGGRQAASPSLHSNETILEKRSSNVQ